MPPHAAGGQAGHAAQAPEGGHGGAEHAEDAGRGAPLAAAAALGALAASLGGSRRRAHRARREAALSVPGPDAEWCDGEGVECRVNLWDGKVYSLRQLRKWCTRAEYAEDEVLEHWETKCAPLATAATAAAAPSSPAGGNVEAAGAGAVPVVAPQVEAWRRTWTVNSLQPLFTSADFVHIHAASGAAYLLLGALWLLDVVAYDLAVLNGVQWERMLPTELSFLCMFLGALNAASGLQPALLGMPRDVPQALGLGERGSPRTGGFVNASLFYFVFLYQGVRVLPAFPESLAPLDTLVGLASIALVAHTGFILSGWVAKKKIHRVDALVIPSAMNLPVSLHLLLHGQPWVHELSAAYPGWPDLFFTANFALAWAACAVTFLLSLYERRVISWELRGILMVAVPLAVFPAIPLHAAALAPEWLQSGLTMLTLMPPAPPGL